jgi:GTPase SAR1 family protein
MSAGSMLADRPRTDNEKRFSTARAELDLLLQLAQQVAAGERAGDPDSAHLAQLQVGIERVAAKAAQQTFRVAVLALAKAGKSTLINALLGAELLPTSNVPETARIVRVKHAAEGGSGRLLDAGAAVAEGDQAVLGYLRLLNAQVRTGGAASAGELLLDAPLVALRGRALGSQPFELLDTPGPNEAGAERMRMDVDRLLAEADVVLYLLDYTKLRTAEERGLFERLAQLRPDLLARLSDRLFFAVNKIDQENSKGLSPAQTRDYVAEILRSQLPGLNPDPQRVLLLSAELALLARLVQSGRASPGALRDFARLCFGIRGPDRANLVDCRPHAAAVLEQSRLHDLEEQVLSFLYRHRGRIFLQSLLDDLERHGAGLSNHLQTSAAALQLEKGQLARQVERLELDRREAEQAFAAVDELAAGAVDRLGAWVAERFQRFQAQLEADLTATGPTPQPPAEASSAAVEARLTEAQAGVAARLKAAFDAFWVDLELEAWERQRALFAELEVGLQPLAARTEQAVSRRLQIQLTPLRLQLPAPSLQELQQELRQRVDGLIEQRTRQETACELQRVVVAERTGWCSQQRHRNVSAEVTREVPLFTFSPDRLVEHWRRWMRERTDRSVKTARAVIQQQVGAAVDRVRRQLAEHWDGYDGAVRRALDDSRRGEEQRRTRLAQIEQGRARLREVQDRLERCREFLQPSEAES